MYFNALGDAATSFDDTLTSAVDSYYNSMLEAQITRSQSHFGALNMRYDAIESAVNAYSVASFNAAKEASKKQRDAAVKEVTDNAKAEKDAKEKEKDHYEEIVKPAEKEREKFPAPPEYDGLIVKPLPFIIGDFEDWLNDFNNLAVILKTTNTQTVAAKPARDSAMNNAINTAKLNNENIRKETDKQAASDYRNSENTGWNDYYSAITAAESAYLKAHKQTENTFNNTKKQADNSYDDTVIPAWLTYSQQLREYETLFTAAVACAGNPGFNANAYFNGSKQNDYNVVMAKQQGGDSEEIPPFGEFPQEWLDAMKSSADVYNYRMSMMTPIFDNNVNRCHEAVRNPCSDSNDWNDFGFVPVPLTHTDELISWGVYGPELPPGYHEERRFAMKSRYEAFVGLGMNKAWARSQTYYRNSCPPHIRFISKDTTWWRTGTPWTDDEMDKIHDAICIIVTNIDAAIEDVDHVKATLSEEHLKIAGKELDNYRKVLLGVKAFTVGDHGIMLQQRKFNWFSKAEGFNYNVDTFGSLIELNTRKGLSWKDLNDMELAVLLFHEISHDFGTKDDNSKGYLMNAYNISPRIVHVRPRLYSSPHFWQIFKDLGIDPPFP